ncbi:hypothetical protein HC928_18170 [bacterium]|nr:hypothetical protein [bacterium]
METLKASQQGLQKIRQARLSKGWTVDDFRWVDLASRALGVTWEESGQLAPGISEGTWKRFLAGKQAIKADAFRAYCQVLDLDWQDLIETKPVSPLVNGSAHLSSIASLPAVAQPAIAAEKSHLNETSESIAAAPLLRDWGDAPDVSLFFGRSEELDTLLRWVSQDHCRLVTLLGMGGIGKSVLATAFAHDRKVRFAFPDGIVWLTVGRDAKLYELYRAVGVALGDDLSNYPDETTAHQNAQKALAGKKCLLILDDVWELPVGRAFRDLISGTVTRLLITTRNLQINDLLNANEYRLKLIDKSQAVDYLRSWASNDPKLDEIAEKLGYLFLALKLAGARMKKDNLSGADYLRIFDRVSRMKIDRNAVDRDDSLEVSIKLSVDAAFAGIEDNRLLYHTFGIFKEDTAIPQQTILQLWRHLRPDIDEFDLLETLNALVDLALVERNADNRTITLHDLLHSYSREKLGNRYVQTHRDLLDSYGIEQWHELPPMNHIVALCCLSLKQIRTF